MRNRYRGIGKTKIKYREFNDSRTSGSGPDPTISAVGTFVHGSSGLQGGENTIYQDNKSCILMAENGKRSSGKQTHALNIRYFYITDQIEWGNVEIRYCPTDEMTGDYMSKGLQGFKFKKFDQIMGFNKNVSGK